MRIRIGAKRLAVLAIGSGLALGVPGLSGVSQAATTDAVHVGNPTLADRGAVMFVPLTFTCPAGEQVSGFSNVTITEAVNNVIVQGGVGFGGATCTGSPQTAVATVVATTRPFRRGSAWAQANLSACQVPFNFPCDGASDSRSVRIK
jgi:hypothetical protein